MTPSSSVFDLSRSRTARPAAWLRLTPNRSSAGSFRWTTAPSASSQTIDGGDAVEQRGEFGRRRSRDDAEFGGHVTRSREARRAVDRRGLSAPWTQRAGVGGGLGSAVDCGALVARVGHASSASCGTRPALRCGSSPCRRVEDRARSVCAPRAHRFEPVLRRDPSEQRLPSRYVTSRSPVASAGSERTRTATLRVGLEERCVVLRRPDLERVYGTCCGCRRGAADAGWSAASAAASVDAYAG